MEIHRDVPFALEARDGTHVIEVGVRQPYGLERGARAFHLRDNPIRLGAWVDQHALDAHRIRQEIAVLLERPDREAGNRQAHWASHSAVNRTGASAVSSTGDSPSPWCASQRSASSAAMHPVPAAVIACR